MKASTRIESIPPATPLSRMLAAIRGQQQSPGLNPKEALHNLDRLISERAWENEVDENGAPLTFQRVLEDPWPDGVGMSEQRRKRLFELAEDAGVPRKDIARISKEIDSLLPALKVKRAGPGRGHKKTNRTTIRFTQTAAYWRARLERDAAESPAVAAELDAVRQGRSTANAAAVRLGWRSKKHCSTCRCFDEG